jgi:hypothetical protein
MTALATKNDPIDQVINPLDAVEVVLSTYNLEYIRADEDQLAISISGKCAGYQIYLTWQAEFNALQIIAQYPSHMNTPPDSIIAHLLMKANAQLWLGHFELSDERVMQYRYTTILSTEEEPAVADYLNDLLKLTIAECDRFFPAYQIICHDMQAPADTLAFAMQDTVGMG